MKRLSVRLSVPSIDNSNGRRRICRPMADRPGRAQEKSIDSCERRRRVPAAGADAGAQQQMRAAPR